MKLFKKEQVYYLDIVNATLQFSRQSLHMGNEIAALQELDNSIAILFKFQVPDLANALIAIKEAILAKPTS